METKKLGFLIMGLTAVFGVIMFSYMNQLNAQGQQLKCNPTQECRQVNSMLGVSHIAVGFLSFIFALGFYLLFFNNSENKIIKKSEISDKFSLLLRPLDDNEKKVLMSIKEQEGITQSTLRFRANLSKAKISQILTDFEQKRIIERKAKGKTYQVFLTDDYGN